MLNVECPFDVISEIKTAFKFNDAVLRHMVLVRDEAVTEASPMAVAVAEEKAKEKEVAAWHKKMLGVPEAEVFVQLLVTIFLLDKKALEDAIACASSLIQRAQSFNRR